MKIKSFFQCLLYLLTFTVATIDSLSANSVLIGNFTPYASEQNSEIEKQIQESLKREISDKRHAVSFTKENRNVIFQNATISQNQFYIEGQYSKTKDSPLSVYIQIYDPNTGRIIDAMSESLNLKSVEGVELDAHEINRSNQEIINVIAKQVAIDLELNPERKESRENIQDHLISKPIYKQGLFPISQIDTKEGAREAFKLIEEQTVVTASRREQKISDAPAAIYVVTEKQIKQRGYRTLVDVLPDIPGFDIIHNYGIYPELIHQRGLVGNNQRTLFYVDGIPDNNLTESAILGGSIRFPLNNVERIEIISGPASALYGANAFNGIINIITKDGKSNSGNHVDVTYGSWESNFRNPGASVSFSSRNSSPNGFSYSVGGYYYKTDGPYFGDVQRLDKPKVNPNDALYGIESTACGGTCNPNSSSVGAWWSPRFNVANIDTYNITGKFSYKDFRFETINWQYLQGQGSFVNGSARADVREKGYETGQTDARNLFKLIGYTNYGINPRGLTGSNWNFKNNSNAIGYKHEFTKKLILDSELISRSTEVLSSSHEENYNRRGPYAFYNPGQTTLLNTYSRPDYSYEIKEKLIWDISKIFSVITGLEAQHVVVPAAYGSERRFTYSTYSYYFQGNYKPTEKLIFTFGYRYDYNTLWGNYQTPRTSAIFKLTKDITLKLLLGTGFRAPTAWELFNATTNRKANPDLKPEKLRSFEGGVGYRFLEKNYINLAAYYNDIANLILEVATTEPNPNNQGTNWNQNQNVASAKIYGTDITFDSQLLKNLAVNLGYSYNRGEYVKMNPSVTNSPSTIGRAGDDYSIDIFNAYTNSKIVPKSGPIPNIAPHKISIGFTYNIFSNISIFLGLNHMSIRRTVSTNPVETIPAYTMFKMNFRWEDFFIKDMFLQVLVNNISNERFFDPGIRSATGEINPTMHPLERRNIWFTVGYKF